MRMQNDVPKNNLQYTAFLYFHCIANLLSYCQFPGLRLLRRPLATFPWNPSSSELATPKHLLPLQLIYCHRLPFSAIHHPNTTHICVSNANRMPLWTACQASLVISWNIETFHGPLHLNTNKWRASVTMASFSYRLQTKGTIAPISKNLGLT